MLIKKIFIAMLVVTMAVPAWAGTNAETGFGAIVGAVAGRALTRHSDQRTQNIATGLGALAGGMAGNAYGDRADRREVIQQQYANNDTYRSLPQETRVVRSVETPRVTEWVEQPQPVQRVSRGSDCDEAYYRGQYNPEAAQAYCQGRRERDRQVREAYQAGLAGR